MLAAVYQNFTFKNPVVTLSIVIWGVYAGIVLAGLLSLYNKLYLGEVVRRLGAAGACSPDTALTFEAAGLKAGFLRRRAVFGGTLSRYVAVANLSECAKETKNQGGVLSALRRFFTGEGEKPVYDAGTARLYLITEKRDEAEIRYRAKGNSPVLLAVFALVMLVAAGLLTVCIPYILSLLDSVISMFKAL